ncbi:arginase family protein [Microbacterium protaetiae]|uniref:Arginase family protein n=1 Tax=Microbacterium protaetiae TaxID=2509458 RepID=A0A4P6EKM5_9MICO|nr:arginase family protein [Microbacterium protaetiae]QAY60707.1 arginase family protein [Microbacterium protaetiae]
MTRFIVAPQWQGSGAARAMLLVDGAQAIEGDLPSAACTHIDVPLEAGEGLGTRVHRLSALEHTKRLLQAELAHSDEPALVVGGDCGVAVPAIAHAAARHPGLAVVWCDAHGDLHTPDSSPSGAFAGMALRAVLGEGEPTLVGAGVKPTQVVLVGARDLEPAEDDYIGTSQMAQLFAEDLADDEALIRAVAGADAVYVHVDLDVLDPPEMTGVSMPVPFGVHVAELTAALARLRSQVPLVGASLAGFAPASPAVAVDDLGAILRIVGALA